MDGVLAMEQRLTKYPEWVVTSRFDTLFGDLQLVSLRIEAATMYPWPPKQPLDTAVIRGIHINQLYRRVRDILSIAEPLGIAIEAQAKEFRRTRRPGKARRP